MTISSIGTGTYAMGRMSAMGGRPSPQEMFSSIDEDGSGGLDQVELSGLVEMISEATGEEVDAGELLAAYDEDGDGALSEEETHALMEDYRPEEPPPGGMGPMPGTGMDLASIFEDADEDEDGVLDETEAEGLAEMISEATGETISAEDLVAEYDEDGDGVLSETETTEALEANRPDGPPPPPPDEMAENEISKSINVSATAAIESYLQMAALGSGDDQASLASTLFGNSSVSSSAAALFSINTNA